MVLFVDCSIINFFKVLITKMKIFETERLIIRELHLNDADAYFDMMGNINVMRLIPSEIMTREESDAHLQRFLDSDYNLSDTKAYAIESKEEKEFIGLCAFLKNDENEDEIGYRLREKFWRRGFGTEITKGLIHYGFTQLNMKNITADVNIVNIGSVKILEKFMNPIKEFFNEEDNCTDRRYVVKSSSWV